MNKALGILVAAGLGIGILAVARLRQDMKETREGVAQLKSDLANTSSQVVELRRELNRLKESAPEKKGSPTSGEDHEVLKLRAAIADLLRRTGQLEQSRPTNPAPPKMVYPDSTPRSEYKLAGYATPQAAVESYFWAITQLNQRAFLDSMAPGPEREMIEQSFSELPEGVMPGGYKNGAMYRATGIRVMEDVAVSDTERQLKVFLEGQNIVLKPILKKVGDEWKWFGQKLGH